jgi:RNA binding exosome subunit
MFRWLEVSAFCYATESPQKIRSGISRLLPGLELTEQKKYGYHGAPITILSRRSTDRKAMLGIFESLGKEVISGLLTMLENRLDEESILHIRLDKQALILGGCALIQHGDAVVIRCKVDARTRGQGIEALREFLSKASTD